MNNDRKIKNAVIDDASLFIDRSFILNSYLTLDYGGSAQGFGGYVLYLTKTSMNHETKSVAGHFITRCMEIADVENWRDMKGRTIRVEADHGKVYRIGHIVKDDWFDPAADFAAAEAEEPTNG